MIRTNIIAPALLLFLSLSANISQVSSFTVGSLNSAASKTAFTREDSKLRMMEECPEIPFTAQLDPKYDTCIIALG